MLNEEPVIDHSGQTINLRNITCPYCGILLDTPGVENTEDHVIARNLVPKGSLENQWNVHLRACGGCNSNHKSALENDLSAITMHPDAWNQYASTDESFIKNANRKAAGSFSSFTKKYVKDSSEEVKFTATLMPGVEATFTLVAPPQAARERIYLLAWYQTTALYYWLTFDENKKTGRYLHTGFFPLNAAAHKDWGNPLMRAFMDTVASWEFWFTAISAQGYFKTSIRKQHSRDCWSSALEWNQGYRIISLFGEEEAVKAILHTLPRLQGTRIPQKDPGHSLILRQEIALTEEDDKLFSFAD